MAVTIPYFPAIETLCLPPKTRSDLAKEAQDEMNELWIKTTKDIDQDEVIKNMRKNQYWKLHEELNHVLLFNQDELSYAQYLYVLERVKKCFAYILNQSVTTLIA